jgi:hypothetical protein
MIEKTVITNKTEFEEQNQRTESLAFAECGSFPSREGLGWVMISSIILFVNYKNNRRRVLLQNKKTGCYSRLVLHRNDLLHIKLYFFNCMVPSLTSLLPTAILRITVSR